MYDDAANAAQNGLDDAIALAATIVSDDLVAVVAQLKSELSVLEKGLSVFQKPYDAEVKLSKKDADIVAAKKLWDDTVKNVRTTLKVELTAITTAEKLAAATIKDTLKAMDTAEKSVGLEARTGIVFAAVKELEKQRKALDDSDLDALELAVKTATTVSRDAVKAFDVLNKVNIKALKVQSDAVLAKAKDDLDYFL